jgi:hypothetical protein
MTQAQPLAPQGREIPLSGPIVQIKSGSNLGARMKFLTTDSGRRIAYAQSKGTGPGVVFLGGFMSDMTGTKALHLEAWCKAEGRGFLRFDYSGHGASSEAFTDGCIGDWAEDAQSAICELTEGAQILVGSSMDFPFNGETDSRANCRARDHRRGSGFYGGWVLGKFQR